MRKPPYISSLEITALCPQRSLSVPALPRSTACVCVCFCILKKIGYSILFSFIHTVIYGRGNFFCASAEAIDFIFLIRFAISVASSKGSISNHESDRDSKNGSLVMSSFFLDSRLPTGDIAVGQTLNSGQWPRLELPNVRVEI